MDDADVDPSALLGLGYLSPGERAAWEQAGQEVFVATAGDDLLPQLDAKTAVGVTATAVDDFIGTTMFGMTTALVWVLPDNFTLAEVADDLAGFWNFRALRLQHRGTVTVLSRLSSLRGEEANATDLTSFVDIPSWVVVLADVLGCGAVSRSRSGARKVRCCVALAILPASFYGRTLGTWTVPAR
jgi:hypothetical protein